MMEPTYNYIADLSQHLPDIPPDSILSRSIYSGDDVKATLFGFSAGQELTEHTASYPAIIHFLQGEAELTLGNDRMEARAGTWAHMPARLPHSIRAKTPVVMLLLLISNQQ
jgi:quercetin dioxygenase-like cupin family protein